MCIYTHKHKCVFKKKRVEKEKEKISWKVEEHERDLRNPTGGCGSIRLTDDR